jgi:acyl dehydratase
MMADFSSVKPGDQLPPMVKGPVTRQHLVEWCAAENDYYHLHYDERVAAHMHLPGTPVQGTYKLALLGQFAARWHGPNATLRHIDIVYRSLTLEGDSLTCRGTVTGCRTEGDRGIVDLELWCENGDGTRSATAQASVGFLLSSPARPA